MKINTSTILLDVYNKPVQVYNGKVMEDLSVGEVLINEINNSNLSPKILWGILPKLGAGGDVEISEEHIALIKKVLEASMEKEPSTRYYKIGVYGRVLDILDGKGQPEPAKE